MSEYGMLLTALEPISHHDPRTGSGGNTLTFLRSPKIINYKFDDTPVYQHLVDRICEQHPMPEAVQEITSRLSMIEFFNIAFARVFIDAYNSRDGDGLFSGMDRYKMLDKRLEVCAVKSSSLFSLWASLGSALGVGMQYTKHDDLVTTFFTLPPSIQYQMTATMARDHRSITTVARLWHSLNKEHLKNEQSDQQSMLETKMFTAGYDVSELEEPSIRNVVNLPTISANSIRHQAVRGPAMLDFFSRIGLHPDHPGDGVLTIAMENLFDSGGNIKIGSKELTAPYGAMAKLLALFGNGGAKESGSSEISKSFYFASQVRKHYPTLDLLGGTCNAFDLGESRLQVSTWLVCSENADALPGKVAARPNAKLSAFDMLSEVTRTHQAYQDVGQMIYNYETLVPGSEIYTRFMLTPFTSEVTEGALMSALAYYVANNPVVGGQGARGNGHVDSSLLTPINTDALSAYIGYLSENADQLREWMLDGSLGTGKPWIVK